MNKNSCIYSIIKKYNFFSGILCFCVCFVSPDLCLSIKLKAIWDQIKTFIWKYFPYKNWLSYIQGKFQIQKVCSQVYLQVWLS